MSLITNLAKGVPAKIYLWLHALSTADGEVLGLSQSLAKLQSSGENSTSCGSDLLAHCSLLQFRQCCAMVMSAAGPEEIFLCSAWWSHFCAGNQRIPALSLEFLSADALAITCQLDVCLIQFIS